MQFLKIAGFPPDQLQSNVILFYSISGMQHRAGTTLAIHFLFTLKRDRVSEKARIVPIMQHPFSLWGFSPPCSYSHTGLQNVCSGSTVFRLGVIGKIDGDGFFLSIFFRQYGRLLHRRRKHCPMSTLVLWQTRKKKNTIKWMNSQKDGDASFMYPNRKIISEYDSEWNTTLVF